MVTVLNTSILQLLFVGSGEPHKYLRVRYAFLTLLKKKMKILSKKKMKITLGQSEPCTIEVPGGIDEEGLSGSKLTGYCGTAQLK